MTPLSMDPIEEARRNWRRRGEEQPMAGSASIIRASQIVLTEVNRVLRPLKLNYARYELLMLLTFSRAGMLPMGKIGARLQVHPTSVTNTVDHLERANLVKRVAHPEDRRGVLAELTDEGRALAEDATEALRRADLSIAALDGDEVEQLTDLLRKVRYRAGDFEGDPAGSPPSASD